MESSESDKEAICCPKFDPAPWDNKIAEWKNKKFIRDRVTTFFFMPLNFGKVMKRLDEKVRQANAKIPDNLCISDHTSRWNMDVYLAVDKDIPGAINTQLSGRFFSRVYEGPFSNTGKWGADFESAAKVQGHTIKRLFMWYTTCPKCAKKYGKNYVVFLGQLA